MSKIKKADIFKRNNKQIRDPLEITRLENMINSEILKEIPKEQMTFSLLLQIQTILVNIFCIKSNFLFLERVFKRKLKEKKLKL